MTVHRNLRPYTDAEFIYCDGDHCGGMFWFRLEGESANGDKLYRHEAIWCGNTVTTKAPNGKTTYQRKLENEAATDPS